MIPLFKVFMPANVDKPLLDVLHSGFITQGPKVEEFEGRIAAFLGTKNVVSVNSGTSALTLALRLAGVGPGDEVISTPMTCTATNLPVLSFGAKIVFADVDPLTGNINPETIENLITKKTKAILFVDWGGMPADLEQIMSIARAHDLKVIEDAAHAFGAEYHDKKVGTIADFTCFSLQAIKHITTGDGGILTCLNPADYKRAKLLRWFGINREQNGLDSRISEDITEFGYKFHMNDLTATIGIAQMDHIQSILSKQRKNAMYMNRHLSDYFVRNDDADDRRSAWWLYTLILPTKKDRDDFKKFMTGKEIMVNQVHRRNDEYTVFKPFTRNKSDGLDYFYDRMICIPIHWGLTEDDLETIVSSCNSFARKRNTK